jgi:pimeloyl-ACP methyl ester carboxylesterase
VVDREEFFVDVADGQRVFCVSIGSGPEVLLVTIACWLAGDVDALADGRRVVLVDPRGRGRSDSPSDAEPFSVDVLVDDLDAVRKAVAADRVSVFGWSGSGAVAARYAMDYADRVERVLTVGWLPPRRTRTSEADLVEARRRITSRRGTERAMFVDQLRTDGVDVSDPARFAREEAMAIAATQVPDPRVFDRMESAPWIEPNEQGSRWIAISQRLAQAEARRVSGQLNAPTLVMYGDEDRFPMSDARDWRWSMPDARLLVLHGVGHYPWLEQPESFFADANAFLNGAWPRGAEPID